MTSTGAQVRYDSSLRDPNEPVLETTFIDDNGVPHATATQFRAFIAAWAANDPNGTWDPSGISVSDGYLTYEDEIAVRVFPADDRGGYSLDPATGYLPWWIE